MTDRKSSSGAATGMICDIQDLEPKQEKCVAGGSERKWEIPSLQDLEEVLHSAPRSCRHGDEVWPNLFLGDMWVSWAGFKFNVCTSGLYSCVTSAVCVRFMSHDKFGLYQLGITHVLNASHGKLCCKGSDDFYGTTVKYYGVPANDLPTFDLSPYFYPAAEFIHQGLTSGGTANRFSERMIQIWVFIIFVSAFSDFQGKCLCTVLWVWVVQLHWS